MDSLPPVPKKASESSLKASVLGVGSELTSGQIVNKNASWISQELKKFGLQTSLHLVVPDEKELILQGLQFCADHSDIIFVTGGLGPTSDDFTRELVTTWAGQSMEFHTESWNSIVERMTSRNYPVREFQKQQCYFPLGSTVLKNPEGTANGFWLQALNKDLFALPGPPREIEAIWKLNIESWLKTRTQDLDRFLTLSWDTMGWGESEIAKITEEALEGSQLEIGYRVHLPYVEVKVSFYSSQQNLVEPWLLRLEKVLAPLTISRDGEDIAKKILNKLSQHEVIVLQDELSQGFLQNRWAQHWRDLIRSGKINLITSPAFGDLMEFESETEKLKKQPQSFIWIQLKNLEDSKGLLRWSTREDGGEILIENPITNEFLRERRRQLWAELAMVHLWQSLQ